MDRRLLAGSKLAKSRWFQGLVAEFNDALAGGVHGASCHRFLPIAQGLMFVACCRS